MSDRPLSLFTPRVYVETDPDGSSARIVLVEWDDSYQNTYHGEDALSDDSRAALGASDYMDDLVPDLTAAILAVETPAPNEEN